MADPVRGADIAPSWTTVGSLSLQTNDATVVQDSKTSVLIVGGLTGSSPSYTVQDTVTRYNLTTGDSTSLAPLPEALFGSAGAADEKGRVYIIGGLFASLGFSSKLYIYDSGTDTWSPGQDIPNEVHEAKAACIGKHIYVFGGMDATLTATKLLQVYDIDANSWSVSSAVMPEARLRGALAVDSVEEQIYYIGGSGGTPATLATSTVMRYSVNGGYWGPMDDAPFAMTAGAAVTGPDGLIYVFGGSANPSQVPPTTPYQTSWCFNPYDDSWTAGPDLQKGVMYQGAARNDTSVFAIGGSDGSNGTGQVQAMKVFDYHIRVSDPTPGPGQEITIYIDIDHAFGTVERTWFLPMLTTPDGYSSTLVSYIQGYSMAVDTDRSFVTVSMPEDLVLGEYSVTFHISGVSISGNEVILDVPAIPLTVTSTETVRDQVSGLQSSIDSRGDTPLTYLAVVLSTAAVLMLALMLFRKRQ